MSGGSHNYEFEKVREEYLYKMEDKEMDYLVEDLINVFYILEWWKSGDLGEDDYRAIVKNFKRKWFKQSRKDLLRQIVEEECDNLKQDILKTINLI